MFVQVSSKGQVIFSQSFPGEEDCELTLVAHNQAYFFFIKNERIIGIIPVACGDSKCYLVPKTVIEEHGARVVFCNVNARPIYTDFCALILIKNNNQEVELPTAEQIFKMLFNGTTVLPKSTTAISATADITGAAPTPGGDASIATISKESVSKNFSSGAGDQGSGKMGMF